MGGLLCVEVSLNPHFSYEENNLVNQVEFLGLACAFAISVTEQHSKHFVTPTHTQVEIRGSAT